MPNKLARSRGSDPRPAGRTATPRKADTLVRPYVSSTVAASKAGAA